MKDSCLGMKKPEALKRELFRASALLFAFLGLLCSLFYALLFEVANHLVQASLCFGFSNLALYLVFGYSKLPLTFAYHLSMFVVFATAFVVTAKTGNWGSPVLFAFSSVPFLSVGKLSRVETFLWAISCFVSLSYFYSVGRTPGSALPQDVCDSVMLITLFSILLAVTFDCCGYTALKHATVSDLQQKIVKFDCASRAKSSFLATVSHEMRTPLQGIIGHSELILDSEVCPETKENMESIKRCSVYLLRLISEILDFSKSESDALNVESIPFSITKLLSDVQCMFSNPKGLDFKVNAGPFAATNLLGDSFKLQQCLTNLLSNAEKFTSQGGFIRVDCKSERVINGIKLSIDISDSGIGLDERQISQIFKPYSQADTSTTRIFGGTGLGLCTTKKYVELMGGQISCKSIKGKGSTFSFWVTLQEQRERMAIESRSQIKPASPLPSAGSHLVLVVDDNEMLRVIFKKYLEKLGVDCYVAAGGREAIELCRLYNFSVVFLDLHMPDMDGFMTAREMRRLCLPNMPIIACTADVFMKDSQNYFTGCLHKPVLMEELRRCLDQHLPQEAATLCI